MKRKTALRYCLIFAALALISLTAASCHSPAINDYSANKDVLNFKAFSLSALSVGLNTTVEGTIFIKGDRQKADNRSIQIVARVEIDPRDWGGVEFYIPEGWKVTNIDSDYPQGNPGPERYITILTSGEKSDVRIGNSKLSAESGGGQGSVIIELDPISSKTDLTGSPELLVAVGSKGDVIQGPVSEKIPVPLNIDYRILSRPTAQVNVEADSLIIGAKGQTSQIAQDVPEFKQISQEAVRIIEAVNSQLTEWPSLEEMQKIQQTADYLKVDFNPPLETITSQIIDGKWQTVSLSSAIFFFSGDYYNLVAWPAEGRTDQYEVHGTSVKFDELNKLVKSAESQ